jgi:hypothetical protein
MNKINVIISLNIPQKTSVNPHSRFAPLASAAAFGSGAESSAASSAAVDDVPVPVCPGDVITVAKATFDSVPIEINEFGFESICGFNVIEIPNGENIPHKVKINAKIAEYFRIIRNSIPPQ